ncbi:MAG: hypothetical protein GF334_10205 [Candidatus Altiarchaeales archaeon]|nr:hypothetical protein [Candidatus Altiarchaeales archaeon]
MARKKKYEAPKQRNPFGYAMAQRRSSGCAGAHKSRKDKRKGNRAQQRKAAIRDQY